MSRTPERSGLKSIVDRLISVAQGKEEKKIPVKEVTPPRDIVLTQEELKQIYSERKHLIPIVATLKDIAGNALYDDESNLERLIEKAGAVLTQIDERLDEVGELVAIGIATDADYIEVGILTELQSELLTWNIEELKLYVESLTETEVEIKKEKFVPRNDWERYLAQNYVDEELELPLESDPEYIHKLEQRYERLRSRFHSILLNAGANGITDTELKLPELHHIKVSITGTDRTYDAESLAGQITQGNLSVKERAVALHMSEVLEADFNFYSVLIGTNKKFNTEDGSATLDGIKKTFASNNATMFNSWFWETAGNLPPFAYYDKDTGKWVEEEQSMGDKIFQAFRNILIRGRKDSSLIMSRAMSFASSNPEFSRLDDTGKERLIKQYIPQAVEDVGSNPNIKERVLFIEPNKAPDKLRSAQWLDKHSEWKFKSIPVKSVGSLAVFPWKTAFDYSPVVSENFDQIRSHVSSAYKDGRAENPEWKISKDLNARWATLLAMALAEITLEGAYQDVRGSSSSPMGKPNGAREIDRLMNPTEYAYKTLSTKIDSRGKKQVSRTGEYSIGVIGAVRRFYLPFLDYFGYEGKTLTEHIMESEKFEDIPWGKILKRDATQGWCQQIQDASPLAELALGTFKSGDLRKIGKVDIEAAEISNVNNAFIKEFRSFYRKLMGYIYSRDSSVGAARTKASSNEDLTAKTNPTGKYMEIRIVDEEGNSEPGSREFVTEYDENGEEVVRQRTEPVKVFTRIHQYFHISPQDLHRWVDDGRQVKAYFNPGVGSEPGVMTIVVKRSRPEKNGEKGNLIDPNLLIARELVYKYLFITQYEGDVIKDLRKEDMLLLGMMLSSDIREKFRMRYFSGILAEAFTRIVSKFAGDESFFIPEIPNIEGPDIFDLKSFDQMLYFMSYEYRIEDLLKSGGELATALSSGTLPKAK